MSRVFLAVAFMASAACVPSPKIGYDYDRGVNFGAYRTYDWLSEGQEKTGDRRADDSALDLRIRMAVQTQLLSKGYRKLYDEKPDFYVAYHIGLKDMAPTVSDQYYSHGMAGRPFSYSADTRSPGRQVPPINEGPSYLAGSLLIDIIDAASKKVVWRGTAAGEVEPGLSSGERDERTRMVVHKMLSHFPPQ
ncbi:MAG TPA: DUF4136 domain-containing protein [Nitrospiraceae bacterium]|nr:DUF4136 domain-containing protein [Nitrospiraceae bacterium]